MSVEYSFDYLKEEESDETEEIKTFNVITNKDEILQMYLKDVSRIKLLKKDEEIEIGKKIKLRKVKRKRSEVNCHCEHQRSNPF